LKEQLALFGDHADQALSLQIKEIEHRIAQMEKELSELEKGGGDNGGGN